MTLIWNQTRTTLDQRLVRGTYGYYSIVQQYTVGNIRSNNMGCSCRISGRSTTSSRSTTACASTRRRSRPTATENPGIEFGWGSKVAPRLGFAYDVKGDGKWKTYGSWGIFYDIEKLEMPRGAWGADHWITYYWTLDNYNWPAINCDGTPNSGCPGTYIEQNDLRHVSNDPTNNLVDPNMKPFKAQEFVVGMDHELNRLMSIGGRYVHKWVNNAIEDIGVQVVGIGEVFYIANPGYGLGAYPLTTAFPRTPFPVRDYDAAEITFNRRMAQQLVADGERGVQPPVGQLLGPQQLDVRVEPQQPERHPSLGRSLHELHREGLPGSRELRRGHANGLISTSRPMTFKVQGTYMLPWGTAAGVTFSALQRQPADDVDQLQGRAGSGLRTGRHGPDGLLHQHGPELLADVPVQEGHELHPAVPDPEPVRSGLHDEDDDEHLA